MNQQQHKHLMDRIETAFREHMCYSRVAAESPAVAAARETIKKYEEQPAVAAARETIEKYDEQRETAHMELYKKVSDVRTAAKEAVLFGSPEDAVVAVRKFETTPF